MSDSEVLDIGDDHVFKQHEYEENNKIYDYNQVTGGSNKEVKEIDKNEDKKIEPPAAKKLSKKLYVLNTETLKGNKGVHTIENLYQGFKFKGKGHEKEDLDGVIKRLEYWAYRLFPKLDFDDFLTKCENLGHKKGLQTHLKKYRIGMITATDIFTQNDIIEDDKEDDPDILRTESKLLAEINNDEFQRLFDESERTTELVA